MKNYLSQLNAAQRDAVEYLEGPELVIAGAGSGKTRVLTYKIVHLLSQGYEPWRILALTFTNKAAREMRERVEQLVGAKVANQLWMGTFHSIFSKILHRHSESVGYGRNFTIYDSADSKSLIKMIIKDMHLDDKIYKPSAVQSSISSAKNALISPEEYARDKDIIAADNYCRRGRTYEIYAGYNARCRIARAMDFDDLLYYTNVLLRDNPEVLAHYRELFRYVLVDEYQDTNYAQHVIIERLCKPDGNLCVVGDDAQSIYSFRGANIKNILGLKNSFPSLAVFKLEQNYRSTQNIVNAANSLIDKNIGQIKKNVYSENAEGDKVCVLRCYSDLVEAAALANHVLRRKMKTGGNYEDTAVLYRTNAQSRILEEAFRKQNIPYRIYGGLAFYQRKEIKDAVAYLRLAVNPGDDEAMKRIINVPARGIGTTTMEKLVGQAIEKGKNLYQILEDPIGNGVNINRGTLQKLEKFKALIDANAELVNKGFDAHKCVVKTIANSGLLSSLIGEETPENISRRENLEELINASQQYVEDRREEEGEEADISLQSFLTQVSLSTDQDEDDENPNPAGKVTMMTIHASKGLEFKNVFICGVEDEIIPGPIERNDADSIEEERRLLYVAITRAKEYCMLSYAGERFRNGTKDYQHPSQFLRDIDSRWLHWIDGLPEGGPQRVTSLGNFRRLFDNGNKWTSHERRVSGNFNPQIQNEKPAEKTQVISEGPAEKSFRRSSSAEEFSIHLVSEFYVGIKVEHQRFGPGVVTKIDKEYSKVCVDFKELGEKTLLLKFAKLKVFE